MENKISVILVNYNGKQYNDKCITSILYSSISEQLQIVVVDNSSTDGSYEELLYRWGNHEQVHLIKMEDNEGFSKANNVGIEWSLKQNIDYFLLLNNDTEVEPDAIERMWLCQKNTKGIVTPKILYADQRNIIWSAGGTFSPVIMKASHRGLNREDKGQYNRDEMVSFATGCALFLSREIVEKLGLLDEKFFLYYEDTEYSLRALHNKVPIWYCANTVIYHKVNGSTKGNHKEENVYYITRNWLACNEKYLGMRTPLFILYFLLNRLCWIFLWLTQGRKEMVKAVWTGIVDFHKKRYGKYCKPISK